MAPETDATEREAVSGGVPQGWVGTASSALADLVGSSSLPPFLTLFHTGPILLPEGSSDTQR